MNKPSGISVQSNVGTFCGTQLPNTFVALCNTYIIHLAPKTKESVFSKRAGPFFLLLLQHFSKSTRFSSWNFWNLANICNFFDISHLQKIWNVHLHSRFMRYALHSSIENPVHRTSISTFRSSGLPRCLRESPTSVNISPLFERWHKREHWICRTCFKAKLWKLSNELLPNKIRWVNEEYRADNDCSLQVRRMQLKLSSRKRGVSPLSTLFCMECQFPCNYKQFLWRFNWKCFRSDRNKGRIP